MGNKTGSHYDADYFAWQQKIGKFGGTANRFKFEKYIPENAAVLDFGCGGGYLLKELPCRARYGLEINEVAREEAIRNGIQCKASLDEIPRQSIDVVISNSCLEHVPNPYETIKSIRPVLKKEGILVFSVPSEHSGKVAENDINQHLYTWTPQLLKNLFELAGYQVLEAEWIKHKWPPMYDKIQKLVGWKVFHVLCRINSRVRRKGYQTRVVACLKEEV